METNDADDLVTVKTAGPTIDGILVEQLKSSKAVVAVMDGVKGPVLRTVPQDALAEPGPDDRALRLLVRRSAHASRGTARGGSGSGMSGRAGHTRAAMHRTTGK